jgi:hypothetical protein
MLEGLIEVRFSYIVTSLLHLAYLLFCCSHYEIRTANNILSSSELRFLIIPH